MRRLRLTLGAMVAGCALLLAACGGGGGGGTPGGGNPGLVEMNAETPPAGTTGVAYAHTLSADFPHDPGFFIVTGGALPTGVALDAFTGEMTGYPRQVGTFTVEIAARDGVDRDLPEGRDVTYAEDRHQFSITVGRGPPSILPQIVPAAQFHAGYSYQIDAAGGYPPYVFEQVGGTLPVGLEVTPTGQLAGFPDAFQPLPYEFTVQITDSMLQTATANLSVQIFVLPLVIETSTLPTAVVDKPYDVALSLASPGGGAPYVWSQMALQPGDNVVLDTIGMEVTGDGHVRVKTGFPGPTTAGNYVFTVQVSDDAGQTVNRQLSLKVVLGPVLFAISPKSSTTPGPYSATGANFQPGAVLVFKPGPTQVIVTPTFVNAGLLTFPTAPPKPGGTGGSVPVMVDNGDGGTFTLAAAFTFPATNLTFGSKGFIPSAISSTGIDAADVNNDGRADIVHCGASGFSTYTYGAGINGPTSTAGGLLFHLNGGGAVPSFGSTTLDPGNFWDCKFLDVNSDGKKDIVAVGSAGIKSFLNGTGGNPLGTFAAGPTSSYPTAIPYPAEMSVGFFDGDSLPDIAISASFISSVNGRVYTMRSVGTGAFTTLSIFDSGMPATFYGVLSLCCPDINADGRSDVFAGRGFVNGGAASLGSYSLTNSGTGTLGSWTSHPAAGTAYSNTTGTATADFMGTGSPAVVVVHTQDPGDGNARTIRLLHGLSLANTVSLSPPATLGKSVGAIDGDFDAKIDWAISTHTGGVAVYRGSTQALTLNLDAGSGSPTVSTPRTGRVCSGDLDGDGRSDLIVTTSYWAIDYQPALWSGSYSLMLAANGGSMGIVFWLNSSN